MRIRVKVNAGSKTESVRQLEPGFYQVRTRAPAVGGKANRRVLELLALELKCDPDGLRIVTGLTKPLKLVEIAARDIARSNRLGNSSQPSR